MQKINLDRGFTLIELLVVVAIISLLSSILFTATNVARAKGRDARKLAEVREVKTALTAFYNQNARMPSNYNCNGTYCSGGGGNLLAIEDVANYTNPQTEAGKAYKRSMQDLVDAGTLSAIPHSPGGDPYSYYDYGSGTTAGALFGTRLEAVTPSSTGVGNSCRPFDAGMNWCASPAASFYNGLPGCPFSSDQPGYGRCYVPVSCFSGLNYKNYFDGTQEYGPMGQPQSITNWCTADQSTDYCSCNSY